MPKKQTAARALQKFTLCTANKYKRHAKPNRRPFGAACLVGMWLHGQKKRAAGPAKRSSFLFSKIYRWLSHHLLCLSLIFEPAASQGRLPAAIPLAGRHKHRVALLNRKLFAFRYDLSSSREYNHGIAGFFCGWHHTAPCCAQAFHLKIAASPHKFFRHSRCILYDSLMLAYEWRGLKIHHRQRFFRYAIDANCPICLFAHSHIPDR